MCFWGKRVKIFLRKVLTLALSALLLPGCSYVGRYFNAEQTPAPVKSLPTQVTYYQVRQGDTLYDVARRFNITERTLILWNQLKSPYLLTPGQRIRVAPLANEKYYRAGQLSDDANTPETDTDAVALSRQNPQSASQPLVDPEAAPSNNSVASGNIKKIKNREQSTDHFADTSSNEVSRVNAYPVLPDKKAKVISSVQKGVDLPDNGVYVIQSGDSLSAIADRYHVTLSQLQKWNDIKEPSVIYVGQKIHVTAPSQTEVISAPEKSRVSDVSKTPADVSGEMQGQTVSLNKNNEGDHKRQKVASAENSLPSVPVGQTVDGVRWSWPVMVKGGVNQPENIIALAKGTSVLAAASGQVIYAGVGMAGYGKMVIIRHKNGYLSAYSNLQSLSVKEKDSVTLGEVIGKSGIFNGQSGLDFEIRQNGQIKPLPTFFH